MDIPREQAPSHPAVYVCPALGRKRGQRLVAEDHRNRSQMGCQVEDGEVVMIWAHLRPADLGLTRW